MQLIAASQRTPGPAADRCRSSSPSSPRPLRPDPGQARSWVERELSRPEYHRSLLEQFLGWLRGLWEAADGHRPRRLAAVDRGPPSRSSSVLLVVVMLAVSRLRREPLRRHGRPPRCCSAPEHLPRRAPGAGARRRWPRRPYDGRSSRRSGRWRCARCGAGSVDERPGLTAHELAADLGPVFPDHAERLRPSAVALRPGVLRRPARRRRGRPRRCSTSTTRCGPPARPAAGADASPPTAAVPAVTRAPDAGWLRRSRHPEHRARGRAVLLIVVVLSVLTVRTARLRGTPRPGQPRARRRAGRRPGARAARRRT